jgi:hypothetical protein
MLRRRVIIPTASADSRTGDPMPISCPVSRGRGCDTEATDAVLFSGDPAALVRVESVSDPTRCGGGTGGARSSDGVVSMPPFPRFGPCTQSDQRWWITERTRPNFRFRVDGVIGDRVAEVLEVDTDLVSWQDRWQVPNTAFNSMTYNDLSKGDLHVIYHVGFPLRSRIGMTATHREVRSCLYFYHSVAV